MKSTISTLIIHALVVCTFAPSAISGYHSTPQPWTCLAKWDNVPIANPQDLCLLFQGDILKFENGMYSFNVTPSPLGFYVLIVSPEHINYIKIPNVSNIANLIMNETEAYALYWIHPDSSTADTLTVTRVYFTPENNQKIVIPPHTLIVPLAPECVELDGQSAPFMRTKTKLSSILNLPTLQFKKSEKLQAAINRSRFGLLNLKPIHGTQSRETQVVGPTKISRVR